jgi:ABC-type oligopeptide transport system substrate-binding subunit
MSLLAILQITQEIFTTKKSIAMPESNTLTYVFVDKNRYPFSTSPDDCDAMQNAVVLEQTVGTLIKFGNGRYENFIADYWEVSKDGLHWDFYLKKNLTTESGKRITAQLFKENYQRVFKIYLQNSPSLLSFDHLEGIEEFKKGTTTHLKGLKVIDEFHLQLLFIKKPHGVLEDLSSTQFGLFSEEDFSEGVWKNPRKQTSTSAYRIESWPTNGDITLKKREDWSGALVKAPKRIVIKMTDLARARELPVKNLIIQQNIEDKAQLIDGFRLVKGTPSWLNYFLLSPKREIFKDAKTRRWFRSKVHRIKEQMPFSSFRSIPAFTFYSSNDALKKEIFSKDLLAEKNLTPDFKGKEIKIIQRIEGIKEREYLLTILSKVFEGTHAKLSFVEFSSIKDVREQILSNKEFDIRVGGVHSGGDTDSSNTKMMFCTTLGVCFPDVVGSVCDLVNQYENDQLALEQFSRKLEQVVYEDAVVIPILYSSMTWLFSNDIKNIQSVTPTMDVPRFDHLEVEE